MTLTEKVIRECVEKGITSQRAIARVLAERDNISTEKARSRVRQMLGRNGNHDRQHSLKMREDFEKAIEPENQYEVATHKELTKSKIYFITTALNNTPVFKPFWDNLLKYAEFKGATVDVIASRYKNPTSVFTDKNEDTWCAEVLPYLDAKRHILFPGIHLMADVKISPTAVTPLTGLNGMSGSESCILGHPRVQFQCMPVPKGCCPKKMMTTGACTEPNYTDSKTGKKGVFHHTYGFVVATKDGIHYVTAKDNGDFIDYEWMVTEEGITQAPPVEALIFGDIHHAKLTEESDKRIKERIKLLKPKKVVLHDVFDGESINPHEENDPVKRVKRYVSGKGDLSNELIDTLYFLGEIKDLCHDVLVVPSNHDKFLDRYIINMDWRKDIANAMKYADLLPIALREDGVFAYLCRQIGVNATGVNDSVKVHGIELNTHGDRGANGSKGSSVQYKNMSFKLIKGHDHSPSRFDGCTSVGCQDLDQGYNEGLSSWGVADATIDIFGKIQHWF